MAIDDLLDEHEQGERVRSWLRKNGAGLIGGVLLGLALILVWQWWQKRNTTASVEANARYEAVVKSIQGKDLDKAAKDIVALDDGKGGVYAELAALRLAKAQMDAGKTAEAIKTLPDVPAEGELKQIVQQRLARVLTDSGKPDEAIKLLADAQDHTSLEIRADALVKQGKRDEARALYTKALATVDVASPQRRLLETKLMDVGGTVPDPAEPI
ncbi:YfgM family protein [Xanthomonas campestris]|uniref:YfgM family protein n=1 Tax=Xanthomonas campestris TaxID=339 RepID=UPI001D157823|nr:tetratricopeptide repeat protein [Xanthomonas campestris]MCC3252890.1 tetratricopeptide repeat protein [Xanthomonas campestris pv. armoraciae]